MEAADVELFALLFLGFGAEFAYFELADHVGEGLAGPGDVAIYLRYDVLFAEGGVLFEEFDCLCSCPVLGVDAGVDDESGGARLRV